jgi:lambda repressor-like predicted transcriptional regulator
MMTVLNFAATIVSTIQANTTKGRQLNASGIGLAQLSILHQAAVAKGCLAMSLQKSYHKMQCRLKTKMMMSSPSTWKGSGTRNEPV